MRRILSLVVVGLVVAAMVLVVAMPALTDAKDENAGAKCSEATLDGRYLFGYDGFVVKGNEKVPFAIAGYEVFDGNGHVKGVATTNENGKVTRNEPFSGTYTVKEDCTGTVRYTDGTQYDQFIAPDGSQLTFVQTKPSEFVTAAFELRGSAKRVGE
jgi:Lipocalin-like domain